MVVRPPLGLVADGDREGARSGPWEGGELQRSHRLNRQRPAAPRRYGQFPAMPLPSGGEDQPPFVSGGGAQRAAVHSDTEDVGRRKPHAQGGVVADGGVPARQAECRFDRFAGGGLRQQHAGRQLGVRRIGHWFLHLQKQVERQQSGLHRHGQRVIGSVRAQKDDGGFEGAGGRRLLRPHLAQRPREQRDRRPVRHDGATDGASVGCLSHDLPLLVGPYGPCFSGATANAGLGDIPFPGYCSRIPTRMRPSSSAWAIWRPTA